MKGLEYSLVIKGNEIVKVENAQTIPRKGEIIRYKNETHKVEDVVYRHRDDGSLVQIMVGTHFFSIEE